MNRVLVLVGASAALLVAPPQLVEWKRADPGYEWSFPADHGVHAGYKTEWWYFTGLLSSATDTGSSLDPEPTMGYQFTIFRIGVVPGTPRAESSWAAANVLMGHMAVTDFTSGRHTFSEVLYRASPPLAGFRKEGSGNVRDPAVPGAPNTSGDPGGIGDPGLIAWSLAPPGTDGRWELGNTERGFRLAGYGPDVSIELLAETDSPPVLQGPGGYSRKAPAAGRASMYYSYPALHTTGTVTVEGHGGTVSGTTWMDHEFFSNSLEENQIGWDWFSIRLDDGRSVMAFQLRGEDEVAGVRQLTLVGPEGSADYLTEEEWSLSPGERWSSPTTKAAYPVSWTLRIPGHDLELLVQARVHAQENVSALVDNLFYWEGAIHVESRSGVRLGQGYLEMTGYGTGSRPAI